MSNQIILKAKAIEKKFGETVALKGVDVNLYRGEVRGLVGENGSGKSTFSSIISGIINQYDGSIQFKGKTYKPSSMVDALNKGIGMIVQEKGTISGVTVAENIFLGEFSSFKKFGFLNKKLLYKEANKALDNIGISHIKAEDLIDRYDMQDRKLIEIAKVVYKDPEILIVDETTTALSYQGRDILYKIIEKFKKKNRAVVLISHDLEELIEKCDCLTVLRDGEWISDLSRDKFDEDYIKELLVGRELIGDYYRSDFNATYEDEIVMEAVNVSLDNKLNNINFTLHKGEILGIGGLSHCGMHELGAIMFGFQEAHSGQVKIKTSVIKSEIQSMKTGIGYVSKDRDHEALSLDSPIKDNISIAALDYLKRGWFIFSKDEKAYVNKQVETFNIKLHSIYQNVSNLSGGNKQKVVFAKWIGRGSDILILDCPTRGVDIGVKQAMYQLINNLKQQGKSFILISEELGELIGMSDRILVMKDGEIKKEFLRRESLNESEIIKYMI